jgi:short-subunit dehydrogenase
MAGDKLRNVLVTGAASGIGLALTRELLKHKDFRVIATARESSLSRFKELGLEESDKLIIRPLEVCQYDQGTKVVDEINERFGGVDVLINNAGVSYRTVVEHMTPEAEKHQMAVNYLGPMHLIRAVIPNMRKKRAGNILNVSSVGGMMAMPTMASYSASKFALEGASESLWYELKPWGIRVNLIQPGFVNSNSFKRVLMTDAAKKSLEDSKCTYHSFYKSMTGFVEKLMGKALCTPESISKIIICIINSNTKKLRVPAGPDARFFYYLRRLLPRRFYHWFLYRNLPNIQAWEKESEHS